MPVDSPLSVRPPQSARPPRKVTIEVKAEWLEEAPKSVPPKSRRRPDAPVVPEAPVAAKRKRGPPIPRED
jgi:hypothetical protein